MTDPSRQRRPCEPARRTGHSVDVSSPGAAAFAHDRPHRRACSFAQARAQLGEAVEAGGLDKRVVDAVREAAGAAPLRVRQSHPARLTEREVLRLVARGRTTRGIAGALALRRASGVVGGLV